MCTCHIQIKELTYLLTYSLGLSYGENCLNFPPKNHTKWLGMAIFKPNWTHIFWKLCTLGISKKWCTLTRIIKCYVLRMFALLYNWTLLDIVIGMTRLTFLFAVHCLLNCNDMKLTINVLCFNNLDTNCVATLSYYHILCHNWLVLVHNSYVREKLPMVTI